RGGYDILITATNALTPLYTRLGFGHMGLSVPHPVLKDQVLNFLLLPMQHYLEARQINPLAWVYVYESTQRFLESLGVARPLQRRPLYKLKRMVGFLLSKLLSSRRRNRNNSHRAPHAQENIGSQFIDPKWTSQHIIAPIIKPYILEAD